MLLRLTYLRRSASSFSGHYWYRSPKWVKSSVRTISDGPARTRFAPSPTGYLHLGSLRTALFNYLLAKSTGGQFLLRIEDTDQKRTIADAEQKLFDDLIWAGLSWDEGPGTTGNLGPYRQSERTPLYQEHAQQLVDSGKAYRCFCSAERLESLAAEREKLGLPTDYDRQCAGLSKSESDDRASKGEHHVIRLMAPENYPHFNDLIYGKVGSNKGDNAGITVKFGHIAYEDPILLKSDGTPTYHLANVVDDHCMQITHVVRGTEWMSSTPKHLELYRAFDWEPPKFAHVGLLVDEEGQKLSKRKMDTNVQSFRDLGILPSALINFVALLGWSHSQRSDVMDLQKLVNQFQMKFTKGNTVVSLDKLWYLQRAHVARAAEEQSSDLESTVERTIAAVKGHLEVGETPSGLPLQPYVRELICADAKNFRTPEEFCERNINFFRKPIWALFRSSSPEIAKLTALRRATKSLLSTPNSEWTTKNLSEKMKAIVSEEAKRLPDHDFSDDQQKEKVWNKIFCEYLRWVVFAGNKGPPLAASLAIVGPDVCRRRMKEAVIASFMPD